MRRHHSLAVPVDADGYFSFYCPHGGERFKLSAEEVTDRNPESVYCPLCGLSGERGQFMTPEVMAATQAIVSNMAIDLINEGLRGMGNTRKRSGITLRPGKPIAQRPVPDLHESEIMSVVHYHCCGSTAKVPEPVATSPLFCPYCGAVAS